ncbi:hypothetical protein EM4838_10340 [Enterococcus mundtii]|nr:hypothetical protein EM4838_10340 [Enterococcus mundtii]
MINKVLDLKISKILMSSSLLFSILLMFMYQKNIFINIIINRNLEIFFSGTIAFILINIIVHSSIRKINLTKKSIENKNHNLFNLFYVNTPKMHEIVMLLDNKIMRSIEREQISEELLKYNSKSSLKLEKANIDAGYSKEESSKRRVYENFDVKTTKSIMLRKIYDIVNQSEDIQYRNSNLNTKKNIKTGGIVLFKNVQLQQLNINDTALLLSILQDSNLKADSDENLELNLNKMMDRMLDDFTIDYQFEEDEKEYIIQLPYKDNENFENGYHHYDLQLGNLSIIGIYRGEIDFGVKDSTSSKFLELTMNQMKKGSETKGTLLTPSNVQEENNPFTFKYNKLEGTFHLIDVVAIIQELNIGKDD